MKKKLISLVLALTMTCSMSTMVFAEETADREVQTVETAETTETSDEQAKLAYEQAKSVQAEGIETEDREASNHSQAIGTIDVSSISLSAPTVAPGATLSITFKGSNLKYLHFYYDYYNTAGEKREFQTTSSTSGNKRGKISYDASTGMGTVELIVPEDAATGEWVLDCIQMIDVNGKYSYIWEQSAHNFPANEEADLTPYGFAVAQGRQVPFYSLSDNGGSWSGSQYTAADGTVVKDAFFFDGSYTYYLQADGTPMTDRLTYHPDGYHLIYLDSYGREVFTNFQYCPSVGYTCYFDNNGYLYKNKITFVNNKAYYLNANGAMEQNGWFQFANGADYGCANSDGTLHTEGFSYDPYGRTVFYHWNGMVARGLISDGTYYYNMDTTDGHLVGYFPVAK